MTWLDLITEPLSYGFMQRAAVGSLALGIAAPVAGVWATSRRLVYLTDAMSHALLAGVAGAALAGASLMLGAFVAAIVMASMVAWLVVRAALPEDSAIGIAGNGLFALGAIGVTLTGDPRALTHILFGNALTITGVEVVAQVALSAVVMVGCWVALPVLSASTFDPVHARTVGVRTGVVDAAVLLALALLVVVGLSTVGVLMALTLYLAPAVAAMQLTDRLLPRLVTASALGVVAAVTGLLVSYHIGLPTGPVVAVVAVTEVFVAYGVGLLRRARDHQRLMGLIPAR
ncbi:metal ABC transporter permease [Nocardioides sp. NPDC057772]|uniref:metal ABC transporter permease n=1 Tax=Nocardioides sp. NPDC057772 TaxID=3346245 RepID=UPI00366DCF5B